MKLKIDKNVPVPSRQGVKLQPIHEAMNALGIGDSFEVEARRETLRNIAVQRGIKVAVRKVSDNKFRVWRIA